MKVIQEKKTVQKEKIWKIESVQIFYTSFTNVKH